jgi:glycosyltransferase involved in cell wall biosynthesis
VRGPSVEIVIPVHNGARDLSECLDSVLRQTYTDWGATVMDNCSTDGSGAIADDYARRDPRLGVVHWTEFVGQAENYNRALAQVTDAARYVKVLEADNWLTPSSLESSVALAEMDETIGLVSGYALMGREILGHGIESRADVLTGREVCALTIVDDTYLFGTPTNLLFRATALRATAPWFQPNLFYDDADLCLRLLRGWKLGFVHQVLAFIRVDNHGVFSTFQEFDFNPAFRYFMAQDHAAAFFDAGVAAEMVRNREAEYYGRLARAALGGRTRAYWDFNRKALLKRGDRLRRGRLARAIAREAVDMALNPKSTVERLLRKVPRRPADPGSGRA